MKTVKNQSIVGLAVQLYGNVDAFRELMELNDLQGKIDQPANPEDKDEIDLGYSLKPNTEINYNPDSDLYDAKAVADLDGRIINDGWQRKRVYSKQYSKQYA